MRWSNFIEIAETSSIHGYSRVFSNWFRTRQRLDESSANTVVHRISPKRVVIEIINGKKHSRSRRRAFYLFAFSGGVGVVLLAIFSLPNLATKAANFNRSELEPQVRSSTPADLATCESLAEFDNLEIEDLSDFEVGGWKIQIYSTARTLGSVWFVNFEAACSGQVIDGLLTAEQIEGGYRILRMTPT
ncbi:MAG: hypothetical protein F2660_04155 [Actinobacteria bacterium]|nr:hypothetical protein [Actinomycetota bacterium]